MVKYYLIFSLIFGSFLGLSAQGGDLEYIESGVTLRMEAPIAADGSRGFYLNIQTNDVYECSNHRLAHDVRLEGNKLLVRIRGIEKAEPCTMVMGPATCRINLTSLKPGKYKMRVMINRHMFKSNLEVTEDYYDISIKGEDKDLFRIYNGHLNLIPEGTIWGTVRYTKETDKIAADKFMKSLLGNGAIMTSLPAGNYGDFYLHHVGKTNPRMVAPESYEYPFVFNYEGDLAVLQELLNAADKSLRIELKNTKGEVIHNMP